MRPTILPILFYLLAGNTVAQSKLPEKIYLSSNWSCHYAYNTSQHYIVKLYQDSSIQLICYFETTRYNGYNTRIDYFGKYSMTGDSLKVRYLFQQSYCTTTGRQNKPSISSLDPVQFMQGFPATRFYIKDSTFSSSNQFFNNLQLTSLSEVQKIEKRYILLTNQKPATDTELPTISYKKDRNPTIILKSQTISF